MVASKASAARCLRIASALPRADVSALVVDVPSTWVYIRRGFWAVACALVRALFEDTVRWIHSFIDHPELDREERRLRAFHLVTISVAIPILVVASIIALVGHGWLRLLAYVGLLAALVGTTFWLASLKDGRWVYRLNLLGFGCFLLALCVLPSMHGTGLVWVYLFPPVAFFVRGPKEGAYWALALLVAILLLFVLPLGLEHLELASWEYKGRMLASYSAMILLTFGYEQSRSRLLAQVVAEREQLEAEQIKLEDARVAAEAATEAKSRFLANMSHEIRTPLHGALGMLHLLDETTLDEAQRESVKTAKRSGVSLLRIIDDVLDVSRIEAGRLTFDKVDVDLMAIVDEVAELFRGPAEEAGLTLVVSVADDVPRHVRADPLRVRQVLANLVSNAIKFTQEGGVTIRLSLAPESGAAATLRFEVLDTGIGISAEDAKGLFEPFTQGDASTTRRFGGAGLGLSIAAQLVRLMGGEIGFQSEEGEGSTFWFTLVAPIVEAPAEPVASDQRLPALGRSPQRVLLAEDNVVNQKVAARMLEKLGCQVEVVADGLEALDALQRGSFDLVMMDCQMPRLDGYEATARIRANAATKDLPVVALTAHAMKGARDRCLAAGMDDYLSKPFTPKQLQRVLQRWGAHRPS